MTRWIAVTIVASIIAAVDGGWLASWTALCPDRIWHGQVWRLVTWPFIEVGPWSLIVTCVIIYKLGGELAVRWGDRRLRRFMLEIVIGAAAVTCVVDALARTHLQRFGGWVIDDVLVIAWARQFPSAGLRLYYGLLTLRGRELVAITVATAVLFAIYLGPVYMAPELAACAAAALYPTGWLRR